MNRNWHHIYALSVRTLAPTMKYERGFMYFLYVVGNLLLVRSNKFIDNQYTMYFQYVQLQKPVSMSEHTNLVYPLCVYIL